MSTLGSTVSAEPVRVTDVLKFETHPSYCRDNGVLLAGSGAVRTVAIASVLGAALFGAPVYAAAGGNTGDGAASGLALKTGAQQGVYTLECITAATNAGVFAVFDPSGNRLADLTVGAAYDNGQFALTIAAGDADFVVGDSATVTIPAGSGKLTAIDFSAVDGSQRAAGVALVTATAADGADGRIARLRRGPATIASNQLVWPSGATDGQKAQALVELEALGITAVTAV